MRPGDAAALLGVAKCQLELARSGEAQAALDELLAAHSGNAAGLLLRGKLDLDRGAPAEALPWLKRAETAQPHDPDVTQSLVHTLSQLGRDAEAEKYRARFDDLRNWSGQLDDVATRAGRDPDNVALRHEAGTLCLRLGRDAEAVRWLASALEIDPDHKPTHRALADYHEQRGSARAAESHLGVRRPLPPDDHAGQRRREQTERQQPGTTQPEHDTDSSR